MKTIATLLFAFVLSTTYANEYKRAMKQSIEQLQTARSSSEVLEVANSFTRIARVADADWLPRYYAAQCYIRLGFNSNLDATERDGYLDMAQGLIDETLQLKADLSEMYALQAMLHTARLVIDPVNRGQQMMMKSAQAIGQSLALNPNNPRAAYLQLSNEVGQAQFFGQDVSSFCPRIKGLLASWDELNTVPELHPAWGKDEVEELSKLCTE
jgi:hypothetical protein